MRSTTAELASPGIDRSTSPIYSAVTDSCGRILSVNDTFLRALEGVPEKIYHQPLIAFFTEPETILPASGLAAYFSQNDTLECNTVLCLAGKRPLSLKWTICQMHLQGYDTPVWQWLGTESSWHKNALPRRHNEVYKSLFYDNPQPMWIYDKATLRFLNANDAAVANYGYTRKEFLEMTVEDIRPASEKNKLATHLPSLSATKTSDKTIWIHLKKDGATMYVEIQSHDFLYEDRDARLVIIHDVTQKEKIQEILLESEARFRNMADNAPVMIRVSDEQDKTIYVNNYWTKFTGISTAEARREGWDKVVHPDDIPASVHEYRKKFMEKKPVSLVYRLRYYTGEYRWVLDKSIPRYLDDGTFLGYIGSLSDIHDYRLAEEKIHFQAGLIENASDVIISTDVQGNIITWNKRAEETYNVPAKEAIAKNIYELLACDFPNEKKEALLKNLRKKGYWQGEVEHRKLHAECLNLLCRVTPLKDINHTITGYIWVNRDITEKIIAEEKVRRNEQKFKSILQHLMDVVWVMNREGIIQYVTPSVTAALGYREEELTGIPGLGLVHSEDRQRTIQLFKELNDNPDTSISADIRIRNSRNGWVWMECRGINKFSDNLIEGMIISLHDISERKQSEQQLQSYSGHITNILNSITDGFIALDHHFNIVWWNPIAEQLTGIRNIEVLGKDLWHVLPELKKISKLAQYRRSPSPKGFSFELYFAQQKRYFDISAYPSQQGLFLYFRDITDRKQQQMLLSLEKAVLELNINPDASLKNTIDHFLAGLEKFNPGLLCSVLLLDEDGKSMHHLSSPSMPAGFIKKIEGIQIGPTVGSFGTAVYLRKKIIVPDIQRDPLWKNYKSIAGRYRLAACWSFPIISSSSKVLGAFAAYSRQIQSPEEEQVELFSRVAALMGVIIENKQAEQKINISNERYMLATRATNDAIWDYDIKSRRLYWGESFYSIFGYTTAHYPASTDFWEKKIRPDDRERVIKLYGDAIRNRERGVVYAEYWFQKADDSYVLVADRAFIIWDEKGEPVRFVGAMQDITERKKMESQLLMQEINRQKSIAQAVVDAQEKERAEIGKELHDNVNQILSTAKLYLELAKTDTSQKEALIKRSADSIFTAINEIRHISKTLVPPSVKDLGLIDSVNDLVESLLLTTSLKVQFRHSGDFDNTITDKQKLMLFRIIQEQVSNVLKHAQATRIKIDLVLKRKLIHLSIVDNGRGFEPEKIKFKKGVGLSNIESRAHLFSGELTITTAPGKGCKLFIKVPIHHI